MENVYYNRNRYFLSTKGLLILLIVIFVLVSFPAKGQMKQKKALTEGDYHLWNYLEAEEISDNGNWISYKKTYETADSLFLQQRKTGQIHSFANGSQGQFAADHYFLCRTSDNVVHVLSLKKGTEQLVKNIKSFEIFGSYILTMSSQKESSLAIYNLEGRSLHTEDNVTGYAACPDKKKIAVSITENDKNFVMLLNASTIGERHKIAEEEGEAPFQNLRWSPDGNALAFIHYGQLESKLYYYQVDKKTSATFSTAVATVFPETMNIEPSRPLKISSDNKKVFFRIRQRKELNVIHKKNEVQVWNTADKYIYPIAKEIEGWNIIDKLALWEPQTGRFLQFTNNKLPYGDVVGIKDYTLTFNPQDYEPQSKSTGDRDIYITDLNTGNRKLLLKKFSYNTSNLLASPGGKYISYFKEGNWYVYDIRKESHTKINNNILYPLTVPSDLNEDESYGNPGWTSDEEYLLIYDQYDIWKVSPDSADAIRLTKGREKGIIYRLLPQTSSQKKYLDNWTFTAGLFNLKDGLVLKARSIDHFYNGIFLWDLKKGLSEICYTDKRISTILRSKNNIFAWMEEDADLPWQIKVKEPGSKASIVMRSNPQQEKFMWTKRKIVAYQNQKGETLRGILYYPATYQKGKRYPMVVNIYEKQSYQVHYYRVPTLYNGDGFNVGNLTAKGYFVLLPDITYEIGNVGLSAVDCVEAAVKVALKEHDIDEKKIGLIGHSFGGYETDFIITHSKLFTCAVAGAATSNFLSSYLSVCENMDIPNFFKMEYGQARMKVSPYENMEGYLKNSPVIHAANVTTPLLSWTGLQDPQVAPTQSFEFYMALRRLGKTHVMLAYPNEGHDMAGKENAIDLTRRIEAWFDYYLKESKAPSWL
jgi:dipeptidyl aminopeptidase/acylaminoacyl peptidase